MINRITCTYVWFFYLCILYIYNRCNSCIWYTIIEHALSKKKQYSPQIIQINLRAYRRLYNINRISLTEHAPNHQNASAALQSQDYKISSPSAGSPLPISGTDPVGVAVSGGCIQGGPNTVLRVIVESLLYPVSLDILHQIFQRFGKVLKIVTFTKNNSFQVFTRDGNNLKTHYL